MSKLATPCVVGLEGNEPFVKTRRQNELNSYNAHTGRFARRGPQPSQTLHRAWEFAPAPERWSIAQIVTHVIAVQERVIGMIQQNLSAAPPPLPEQDREIVDSIVINQIPNRLRKFPSPISSARQLGKAEAVRQYVENCAALTEMLTATPGLREHVLDSPPLKAISKGAYLLMDGYQWILAAAAHAERHTKQILEVVADSAFPIH